MAKAAEQRGAEADTLPLDEIMKELGGDYGRITPARMVELFQMLPPSGVTQSSSDIVRELRGPLPDDE
jgi:hypothetical protein